VWFDEPLTMTSVLTFSLCFGLSVDDTVHFLMRYRAERRGPDGPRGAILRTFAAVGGVMITTSLVLIGGFLAMLVSQMPAVRTFAVLSCVTLLAAMAGDLVFLPSLILSASRGRSGSSDSAGKATVAAS
jgi:predicted RND superfamily exporter protein